MKHFDVIIIGAGVTGAAIARQLSRYSIKTAIIEKETDVSFGTSKANSGIIHAGFHSPPGMLKTELCIKGNRSFDILKEELGFSFERRGELVVAFNDEELQILKNLYAQGIKNRVHYLELIGTARLREMEPNLSEDIIGALYAPTAGIVEPYEYCFSLIENARQNGVAMFVNEKVAVIAKQLFGNFVIETDSGLKVSARFIVNAAGLHADEIASLAGITSFAITPRKGEEYLLDRRVGNLVTRIIFPVPTKDSKGMLVIPTVEGTVMVGPTAENINEKDNFSTTREGLRCVFENAKKMIPGIRLHDVITSFSGLRPVATGDDFIIGTTSVQGFINAAGIQSPGLTASPAIAQHVEDILVKEGLSLKVKSSWNPKRTPFIKLRHSIATRDYAGYIKNTAGNPGYNKLVCRCENITEAEVTEAVSRGHTTLDGIKFATRAGMGRCQGSFCTYRVLKLLEQQTGIPIEKITKKGGGSEIIKFPMGKGAPHE
ncbi:MAG: NAD(P)/FAD-dependent oxidoreductase [Spirochaetales bacterium]|nr:NAD(P)/FAD-dependent oxidoreductase [Spirochaetales bacterium]